MALLELVNVSKEYHLGKVTVTALRDINLSISPGEFVGITGPSGSGKTTLLNLVGGLDRPSQGEIRVQGMPVLLSDAATDALHRDTIGFIFQNFNLVPVLRAWENVALPLHLHDMKRQQRRERALEALSWVGLEAFADFPPDQLSGGQRQRVAIARALVTAPSLILADEPTASLDSTNAREIVDLMETLNRERGSTFIFSTHDSDVLGRVRRIIRIRDGQITEDEPAIRRKVGGRS